VNPDVYTVGTIGDIDGLTLTVGVDYTAVTVGRYRIRLEQVEELAWLLVRAAVGASRCEASGDD
jgi:hypothetical protein